MLCCTAACFRSLATWRSSEAIRTSRQETRQAISKPENRSIERFFIVEISLNVDNKQLTLRSRTLELLAGSGTEHTRLESLRLTVLTDGKPCNVGRRPEDAQREALHQTGMLCARNSPPA